MDTLTFNRLDMESVTMSSDSDTILKDKSSLTNDEFINDELGDETLEVYVEEAIIESKEDIDLDVDDEVKDISSDDE